MKIEVTYKQVFDSDEFYVDKIQEDLDNLTCDQFIIGIAEYLYEYPEDILDLLKFKEIK